MLPRGRGVWAAAVALLAVTGRPAFAQQDTVLAEAAVEIRFLNGPAEVVPALVYDGTLLLPVHRFFTMAEIKVTAFDLRDSLVAMLEPLGTIVQFNPDRAQLLLGDSIIALEPHDALWWDGDLFAPPDIFERTLGVVVTINWRTLSVDVGRTTGLPVVRRQRRERRQANLTRPVLPTAVELHPIVPTAGGAVLNWSLTGSTGSTRDYYTLDLGLGAQVARGNLTIRPEFWDFSGRGGARLQAAWQRAWPERQWVRQVRIGDVQTSGRRAQLVRGAVVTNAPFVRSSEFDVEQVVGSLPAGWEVEMYDRGRLLGYGTVDEVGMFHVPLQVRYGQNPFELVMYGPTGEVVRQKRTIRVPYSRLPDGRFEYAAALGQCRYDPCNGLFSADARYGLTSRVTLQGGADVLAEQGGGVLWQPYAAVSAALFHPVTLTGEAVANGHLRGAANVEPSADLRITLAHTQFAEAGRAFSGSYVEDNRTEATGLWRPGLMRGTLFLQAFLVHSRQVAVNRTIARTSATARLGPARYTAGLRFDRTSPRGTTDVSVADRDRFAVDLGADAVLPWRSPWIAGTNVRGEMSVEPAEGLAAVAASAGRSIQRMVRADLGISWFRSGGWGLTLSLTTTLPGPRVGVRSQANSLTGTSGLAFVNGSAVYDSHNRTVRWTDGADLGQAGVTGVVYLDDNANGVRDQDEPGLSGVRLAVGGRAAETDGTGQFAVWDLLPFEAVPIAVDSLSFEDPRLILGTPLLEVRLTPNSYVPIEVPVVVGAEISGWVILEDQALAGIPVVLRELNTGAEITVLTFSDGTFYRAGVPPGEWEVTLPDTVADALGVYAMPMHLFIPPGSGDKRYDSIGIELGRLEG